ncbi:hypothetical protein SLEP1_g57542 [Rubroshorea leprosula]|uniref:AAA+ ATPase domain-containing protein n=1 Tax=Rubroshorea leprosula TaxID=152421 RepID=A0AAV5MPE4_9ROSI|nr:hypothetical protein SLEP1_g57542 [Rubroshorea leprosula]
MEVAGFAIEIFKYTTVCCLSRIRFVFQWKKNLERLRDIVSRLESQRNALQQYIDEAIQLGEMIVPSVERWMHTTEEFIHNVNLLLAGEDLGRKMYCFRTCPNLPARYRFNKAAVRCVEVADFLLCRYEDFNAISYSSVPVPVQRRDVDYLRRNQELAEAANFDDSENFNSRRRVLKDIMEALLSPGINSIGVYGAAGVGKTMLVEQIKTKAEKVKLFDVVVMAKVTKNRDWRRIQDEIARDLGIELHDRVTEEEAADRIKSRLTNRKKLKQPLGEKNEEISSECTVLLTSRNPRVLSHDGSMHTQIIEVPKLEDGEAWKLFRKTAGLENTHKKMKEAGENTHKKMKEAGENTHKKMKEAGEKAGNQFLLTIAEEISKRCEGLPIGIATLADTLKDKDPQKWRITLLRLQKNPNLNGISPSLYSAIELRYSDLKSKELKQSLLLCSLMGHNAGLQDLLKYGIGLGLFPRAKSMEKARDEALKLVNELIRDYSLLLVGGSNMHFDMHEPIRGVAISIASGDHGVLAFTKDAAKDRLNEKALKKSKWIYLSNVDASELPAELKCPQLTFFHLSANNDRQAIPNYLFRGAEGLRVLGLTKVRFESIPLSISLLINLHTLCLDQSEFDKDLNIGSIIGELKNLQVLSLARCDIQKLPEEIGKLIRLKFLDLSDCTKLTAIPRDVLSKLTQLEELYLGNSFDQWQSDKKTNASLEELRQLENLTALEVRIHCIDRIPDGLFSVELKRYKIFIGDVWNYWDSSFENSKMLKLKLGRSTSFDYSVRKLLKQAEELHLEMLNGVKNVVNELDDHAKRLLHLQEIRVTDCSEIVEIFYDEGQGDDEEEEDTDDITEATDLIKLAKLKCLRIQHLPKFISFSHEKEANISFFNEKLGVPELLELQLSWITIKTIWPAGLSPTPDSHWKLTKLIIEGCNNLENKFSSSIVRCLVKLKHLEIRECKILREIIVTENAEEKDKILFRELNFLQIEKLQNLIGFYSGNYRIKFPSLKQLAIDNCPELKGFVVDSTSVTDTSTSTTDTALFDDKVAFPNLERMTISLLKNLKILWRKFPKKENSFERLNFLSIEDLQNLIALCSEGYCTEFSYLKQLTIEKCPKLNGFVKSESMKEALFDEKIAFPKLERLSISHFNSSMIIGKNVAENSFCNLKSLRVTCCQNLSFIFPSNNDMLRKLLKSLEKLEIIGCSSVEEVFELGQQSEITASDAQITESDAENYQFKELYIDQLPKLQHVWKKNLQEIDTFQNLEPVTVSRCEDLNHLFPFSLAKSLFKLKRLKIRSCTSLEEIVAMKSAVEEEEVNFEFDSFSCLILHSLPRLRCFYPGKHKKSWPALEKFYSYHCGETKITNKQGQPESAVELPLFSLEKVAFPNLERMTISLLKNLKILWRKFPKKENSFERLNFLSIEDLQNLIALCSEDYCTEFSYLKQLTIEKCPKLNGFVKSESMKEALFDEKIAFPKLERLSISHFNNSMMIWKKLGENSFCNLKSLRVTYCQNLSFIFPSNNDLLRKLLKSLEKLEIIGCSSVEEVFELGQQSEITASDAQITESDAENYQFKELYIDQLPRLKHVWNKDLQEIDTFQNLESVTVSRCESLNHLFPFSLAKSLFKLKRLKIQSCTSLEEIVARKSAVKEEVNFEFDSLSCLILHSLPGLRCFYPGKHKKSWPALEKFYSYHCGETEITNKPDQAESAVELPLFSLEKV